MYTKGGENIHN